MSDAKPLGKAGYGVNTYSFTQSTTAYDCLNRLADNGYRKFEIMLIPGHFWPSLEGKEKRRAIETLLSRRSLNILTLNQPNLDINLASVVPEMRQHSCGVIAQAIELAADWNAQGVIINPGKANPVFPSSTAVMADCFRRSLDALVPIARRAGVKLIVKNHPLSYLYRVGELLDFFKRYGWEQIGLAYDFANGFFGREDAEAVLAVQSHIQFFYAADTTLDEFQHAQVGTGIVPYNNIAAMLNSAGLFRQTILEIICPTPDSALEESVLHLDGLKWQAGLPFESITDVTK